MKLIKLLTVFLLLIIFAGCRPVDSKDTNVSFSTVCSNDISAFSLINFLDDSDYSVTVSSDKVIEKCFDSAAYDFIIAPTNTGIKGSNDYGNYKLFAIISWGSYSLVTNNIDSNKTVYAPDNETLRAVINECRELAVYIFDFTYSEDKIAEMLANGECSRAILSEPYLTVANEKWTENNESDLIEIYNLQNLYSLYHEHESFPMYSLFVKNETLNNKPDNVVSFVSSIKNSLLEYMNDNDKLVEKSDSLKNKMVIDNYDLLLNNFKNSPIRLEFINNNIECINEFLSMFDLELESKSYVK